MLTTDALSGNEQIACPLGQCVSLPLSLHAIAMPSPGICQNGQKHYKLCIVYDHCANCYLAYKLQSRVPVV